MMCACNKGGAWGQGGPGMGDLIVYDAEVHAKKDEVNHAVDNLKLTVDACVDEFGRTRLLIDDLLAVQSFIREWKAFYVTPIPFWGAAEAMAVTLRYQARASQWRDKLAPSCVLVGPSPLPEPQKPPGATELAQDWIGMLKIAIPAAAVIAIVILAAPLVWEYAGTRRAAKT